MWSVEGWGLINMNEKNRPCKKNFFFFKKLKINKKNRVDLSGRDRPCKKGAYGNILKGRRRHYLMVSESPNLVRLHNIKTSSLKTSGFT